jgi:hypothetical protein
VATLRFGVIPFEVQYTVAPVHGFTSTTSAWSRGKPHCRAEAHQPSEIAAYTKLFDQFAEVARYGAEARAIITRALADLAANTATSGAPCAGFPLGTWNLPDGRA